jgi:hypothetical protein
MKRERREQRAAAAQAGRRAEEEGMARGCLFCRRSDGGFASVEHIIGETIGNDTIVLPRGVVCDRCNNGPLSRLDEELANFLPIALARTLYGVKRKGGGWATARLGNGIVRRIDDTNVVFDTNSRKAAVPRTDAPGFKLNATGRKLTPKYCQTLARGLLKIGLGCAWLDLGPERTLGPQFDHIRDIVLKGGHHGYFAIVRQALPEDRSVQIQYIPVDRDGRTELAVAGQFYGTFIGTDSFNPEPVIPFDDEAAIVVKF